MPRINDSILMLIRSAGGDMSKDDEESGEILGFFYSIATIISDPIRLHCVLLARYLKFNKNKNNWLKYLQLHMLLLFYGRRKLYNIAYNAANFNEGIQQIKNVILNVLPFAFRVGEIVLEPVQVFYLLYYSKIVKIILIMV